MAYGPAHVVRVPAMTPRGLVEKSGPSVGLWTLCKAFFAITSDASSLFFTGCALVGTRHDGQVGVADNRNASSLFFTGWALVGTYNDTPSCFWKREISSEELW